MELTDAGLLDTTGSSKEVGNIRTNDTALAEKEIDTCKASSERTLVDTGVVGTGATERKDFRYTRTWIYFIKPENTRKLKIGITNDLESRMSAYQTHTGGYTLIGATQKETRYEASKIEINFIEAAKATGAHISGEWMILNEWSLSTAQSVIGGTYELRQAVAPPPNPLSTHKCTRCGWQWVPRTENPVQCPNKKCHSPYWNIEKRRGNKQAEAELPRHDLKRGIQAEKSVNSQKIIRTDVDPNFDMGA